MIDDYDWIGGDMTHEELRGLADLLREVLVMNPMERKAAGEVAEHCWLLDRTREGYSDRGFNIKHGLELGLEFKHYLP